MLRNEKLLLPLFRSRKGTTGEGKSSQTIFEQ